MKKITFLLTLLLMYVGVTPMMARENLDVKKDVPYTIKGTLKGKVRYVSAEDGYKIKSYDYMPLNFLEAYNSYF